MSYRVASRKRRMLHPLVCGMAQPAETADYTSNAMSDRVRQVILGAL